MRSDNGLVHVRIISERGFGPIVEIVCRTVRTVSGKYLGKIVNRSVVILSRIIVPGRIADTYEIVLECDVKAVLGLLIIGIKPLDILDIFGIFLRGFGELIPDNNIPSRAAHYRPFKRLRKRNDIDRSVKSAVRNAGQNIGQEKSGRIGDIGRFIDGSVVGFDRTVNSLQINALFVPSDGYKETGG